jgi:phospholipid/cholesterol/gamma-HCH transport system ATP-binding protein
MIETRHISKSFDNKDVINDINMVFERGKTNLIIGPSGSGKTVLMKCIVGLLEIDEGEILFDDRLFNKMNFFEKKSIRQEMGMMFQGGALFDSLTVEENVMFPITMFTKQTMEQKLDRVNFCLRRVNLENVNKLYPAELSGGMKKRVAIARAISMNPRYLFCDEPNSGLDPKTSIVIDNLISEITKEFEMTTIINTHDMNSVIEIGEKIAFIYNGKLWWVGDKHEILQTMNEELNSFVYATELTRRLKKGSD